jgi:predicted  nucleic acid-binding Zn-ribbon protein
MKIIGGGRRPVVGGLYSQEGLMSNKQADVTAQLAQGQEVERIRDIIFGSQMREYTQRFQTMQRDLERLQQELDRLTERLADQSGDQGKKLQELRQEMRQADDSLRAEFRDTAQKLSADKMDRETLGDLFIELGNQLKTGGSLGTMLMGLVEEAE